jgi:hypothetical protein
MANFTRRNFLTTSAALGAGAIAVPRFARAQGANDAINVGIIGVGGRGNELINQIKGVEGVRIVALCDPDSARTDAAAKDIPGVKTYADMRELLDDDAINAVAVATCNHWHCLAAYWACQAGKDVYCEKPLSHSLWEGRQLVAAAKEFDRIVGVGTQQRSDPMQAEVKDFLHDQRALGAIRSVAVLRFGVRASIGKRDSALAPPQTLDYNLWCGPAQDQPIYRTNWHYDWHWTWNTGDGECGNWGVHILDDVINNVFRDQHKLPDSVISGGGRVMWNDAGESPNLHVAALEAGGTPVLFALSNLPAEPGQEQQRSLRFDDVESGYVVHCEGGSYRGWRGGGLAVDARGNKIREFRGDAGAGHMKNFFEAVRAHDPKLLNAPVEIGHSSAGWAHVIDAAYRSGEQPGLDAIADGAGDAAGADRLCELMEKHIKAYELGDGDFRSGGLLVIDGETEQLSGPGADAANGFLGKPAYRGEFAIPS